MPSNIELQFGGFLNTPALWKVNSIMGLQQFEFPFDKVKYNPNNDINPKLRLGQLVEQFVFQVLAQTPSTMVVAKNLQIKRDKITIGELDCLVKKAEEFTHVEIVYKFYLYDDNNTSVDKSESSPLSRWIGPNRKDDLMQKVSKLKSKQLPLLHREETLTALDSLNLHSFEFKQSVLFKAQLFVPVNLQHTVFPAINNDCITGFYIRQHELSNLASNQFYIPGKKDWLVAVHKEVNWQSYIDFTSEIELYLSNKRSPLCWMKKTDKTLQKFFVVWWD
ncbi:MAG: hypothetical protein ACJAZ2_002160 [Glaciecola sp.]|jgi:hypothetical protein